MISGVDTCIVAYLGVLSGLSLTTLFITIPFHNFFHFHKGMINRNYHLHLSPVNSTRMGTQPSSLLSSLTSQKDYPAFARARGASQTVCLASLSERLSVRTNYTQGDVVRPDSPRLMVRQN